MSLLDVALHLAGMPDSDVAELKRDLPAFARIVQYAKMAEPSINEAKPHINALLPLIEEAMPHINALLPVINKLKPIATTAWPEVQEVLPTVAELIAFARSKA